MRKFMSIVVLVCVGVVVYAQDLKLGELLPESPKPTSIGKNSVTYVKSKTNSITAVIDTDGRIMAVMDAIAARSVLPNSLKTEIIVSGTLNQWQELIKLRAAKAAHPQMRYIINQLLNNKDCPEELRAAERN